MNESTTDPVTCLAQADVLLLLARMLESGECPGIVEVEADEKAKAGRTAMLFSRTNTMLSIPMLYAMVSAQNLF